MSARLGNEAAVERALTDLRRGPGIGGEVFLRDSMSGSVEVKDGVIENVLDHGERGIGVRVLDRDRAGFAHTSDLTAEGIDACVELARAMARVTEPDPDLALSEGTDPSAGDLAIHEAGATDRGVAERAAVALDAERAAREADSRISGFRKTSFSSGETTTVFATTSGARDAYVESFHGCGTSAIASQGEERQTAGHAEGARAFTGVDGAAVGRRAAELAAGKLGARSFATQQIAVVLDPWMAMQLLGAIGALFNADSALKGKSLFAGRLSERVASDRITIVDDARRRGGLRSTPFDGEGTPTRTRTLVERGALRGYLTSIRTARKLGTEPTGNARRASYATMSRIAPSNLHIAAGEADPDGMVRELDRALRITALLNLTSIDPISGEFSLGAAADYLERGAKQYPVHGITIAGNLLELLASIAGVGSDLVFGASGLGSPTLVIPELSVGGTER